ncbi:MAG: iron-containing redox enzyme family protein [Candidatus Dormibacteria bacterium]
MATVESELTSLKDRWNLLEHPFYVRWSRGELTREELREYTGQYAHVVRALPTWLEAAAEHDAAHRADLLEHAAEEREHEDLWARFADTLGVSRESLEETPPNHATTALLERGSELSAGGHGAAAAWAIESQSPEVSREKLAGLEAHYGITGGAEYFEVHRDRDVDHREALARLILDGDPGLVAAAPGAAGEVLRGLWDVLSSVESPRP